MTPPHAQPEGLGGTAIAGGWQVLREVLQVLHSVEDSARLRWVLEAQAARLLSCGAARFLSLEGSGEERRLVWPANLGRPECRFLLVQGIAGFVARNLKSHYSNQPFQDPHFLSAVDGLPGEETVNLAAAPVVEGGALAGVLLVHNRSEGPWGPAQLELLEFLSEQAARALARLRRGEEGWTLARNFARCMGEVVDEWHGTAGHSTRVRSMAMALGQQMNLQPGELLELDLATWLHQVGRIHLLPDAFAEGHAERLESRQHLSSILTASLLGRLELPPRLSRLAQIVACGRGAPATAATLPLAARILMVAERFHRLTAPEAAPGAQPVANLRDAQALAELKRQAAVDLDPDVVASFEQLQVHKVERRRSARFECEIPLEVQLLDERSLTPLGPVFRTGTRDVADHGLRFVLDRRLPVHALLRARIEFPTGCVEGYARVARVIAVRQGEQFEVGAYLIGYERRMEPPASARE